MIDIEVTVYLDIVFFINFIFDFIGIYLTGIVSDEKKNVLRFVCAAALYAIVDMVIIVFNIDENVFNFILIFILVEILAMVISFGRIKVKKIMILIILHMGILFTMGGMVTAIKNYMNDSIYECGISSLIELILIGILVFLLIKYTMPYIIKSIYYRERIYKVTLKLKDTTITVNGLLDSGNVLREQTTGKQVTIVEKQMLKKFFDIHIEKIYVIPYKSIGKDSGILYGIQVDELIINHKKFKKVTSGAVVGIYNGRLSNDNRYNAILHSECLM